MLKNEAELVRCPRLLIEKNRNRRYCITTECMAWVNQGITSGGKEAIGYCTEYGEDSARVIVENMP